MWPDLLPVVNFSAKYMYQLAELLRYVPVQRTIVKNQPDSIAPCKSLKLYIPFAIFSVLIQAILVFVMFESAILEDLRMHELLLMTGASSAFLLQILCECLFLLPFTRRRLVSLMNCVWEAMFYDLYSPSPIFALIFLAFSCTAITYPVLIYPLVLFISVYMPKVVHVINAFIDWVTVLAGFSDQETATAFNFLLRLFVFFIFTVALGHGLNNLVLLGLWALTYHASTVHSLKILLDRQKER